MVEPKLFYDKICKVCGLNEGLKDFANLCKDCAELVLDNLIVKCKACKTVSIIYKRHYDRLDFIEQVLMKEAADFSGLEWLGFGFIFHVNTCPTCGVKAAKWCEKEDKECKGDCGCQ